MCIRRILNNLKNNKLLMMSILFTVVIIGAILVMTFTQFKQIPFIYNEF
ncbi:hypothetical protein [Clostridium baratii]|nr:hypothetical protein [Clostridium baratii]